MGLPVIANSSVGDHQRLFSENRIGYLLQDFSNESLQKAVAALPEILELEPSKIRGFAQSEFSLDHGAKRYLAIYSKLEGKGEISYI